MLDPLGHPPKYIRPHASHSMFKGLLPPLLKGGLLWGEYPAKQTYHYFASVCAARSTT